MSEDRKLIQGQQPRRYFDEAELPAPNEIIPRTTLVERVDRLVTENANLAERLLRLEKRQADVESVLGSVLIEIGMRDPA